MHEPDVFAWSHPAPPDPAKREFLSCLDVPGDVVCKEMFSDGDLVVFYGWFVIYQDADCDFPLFEFDALLTTHKIITRFQN